jgi:catechol 2,3-dioxygenase-like lactoylglutathione lyase family enzyme
MIAELNSLEVITFFVEDLRATSEFYKKIFAHEVFFEDKVCSIMKIGNVVLNLLHIDNCPTLVEPIKVASSHTGSRALYTIKVDDCNSVCAEITAQGVKLLNGPVDRPWGRRTAAFADPAGNVWEVAQELK